MGKRHDFKMTFVKLLSSAKTDYQRRLAKVQAALDELDDGIQDLVGDGVDTAKFQAQFDQLSTSLGDVKAGLGETADAKDAYAQLDFIKLRAETWAAEARQRHAATQATEVPLADPGGKLYDFEVPGNPKNPAHVNAVKAKIASGKGLFDQVMADGDRPARPTKKEVADVMWFLKSQAQGQIGEPFDKGAITVPDPGGKLKIYLASCTAKYTRSSSHLNGQQKAPNGGAMGIDFYDGASRDMTRVKDVDKLLPCGMHTLLIQQITDAKGDQRLYLKMETEGCDWKGGHGLQAIRHGINFASKRENEYKGRRENMPEDLKAAMKALASLAGKAAGDDRLDAAGRALLQTLATALAQAAKANKESEPNAGKLGTALRDFLNGIEAMTNSDAFENSIKPVMDSLSVCGDIIMAYYDDEDDLLSHFGSEVALRADVLGLGDDDDTESGSSDGSRAERSDTESSDSETSDDEESRSVHFHLGEDDDSSDSTESSSTESEEVLMVRGRARDVPPSQDSL